jgi:predicted nucleic acid-binding protein
MSIVNLGEVYYRIGQVNGEAEADTTVAQLRQLAITVVSATDAIVLAAATLKMRHPISYADAFALATAASANAILVTGDPELEALAASHRIEKLTAPDRCKGVAESLFSESVEHGSRE